MKPIWILLKQETVSGSGISWAICKSAPRSRQTTTPAHHHSVFTGRMPFLPPNQQRQQRQSTEGKTDGYTTTANNTALAWRRAVKKQGSHSHHTDHHGAKSTHHLHRHSATAIAYMHVTKLGVASKVSRVTAGPVESNGSLYRQVYDSRNLQADCQEPGSAPEPYARQSSMGYFYLLRYKEKQVNTLKKRSFTRQFCSTLH